MGMGIILHCLKCGAGWTSHTDVIAQWKCHCGATVADLPPLRADGPFIPMRNYVSQYVPPDEPLDLPVVGGGKPPA